MIVLAIWSYHRHNVLILFAGFFMIVISILYVSSGINLSTMLTRYSLLGVLVVLQIINNKRLSQSLTRLRHSRIFLGYCLFLAMGLLSIAFSYTNVSDKLMIVRNMITYTLLPMSLFIMNYDTEAAYNEFPIHFVLLTLISFAIFFGFSDTSLVVMKDRTTIQELGVNSIYLSRIGAICCICATLQYYNNKKLITRIVSGVALVVSLFLILLSSQRATIIGLAIALMFWLQFGIRIQRSLRPILFLVLLLVIVFAYNLEQFSVIDRFKDLENYREYERYSDYSRSLSLFLKKPIFGYGFRGYYEQTGRIYPHNTFLEIMVEYGVTGLVVYFIMLLEVLKAIRWIFYKPSANYGAQAIALSWIVLFVASFFAGTLIGNADYFIISGLLSTYRRKRIDKNTIDRDIPKQLHIGHCYD